MPHDSGLDLRLICVAARVADAEGSESESSRGDAGDGARVIS